MQAVELDITRVDSIRRVAAELIERFPALNVLVNNAGIMPFDDASAAIDDTVAQAIIDTNLLGPVRMTSALIGHLKRQPRAVVLHNTSVLAYVPLAGNAVYSATKAALHAYALSQRFMLRKTSVRVQEIAPPWVDTDLIHQNGDPRAMPPRDFIEQTMRELASDREEVTVEAVRPLRDNPGAGKHAFFNAFNEQLEADPIPVA
ncbi:SDR family oxidoreductase [Azohydromonas caseinilytica]